MYKKFQLSTEEILCYSQKTYLILDSNLFIDGKFDYFGFQNLRNLVIEKVLTDCMIRLGQAGYMLNGIFHEIMVRFTLKIKSLPTS